MLGDLSRFGMGAHVTEQPSTRIEARLVDKQVYVEHNGQPDSSFSITRTVVRLSH